jgi:branched-chain amino acid transport system ATP-binding protein
MCRTTRKCWRRILAGSDKLMLEVKNLFVSYGHIEALRGVHISIKDGEVVSLIGSNGSGKSTLLAAILGVQRPSAGSIHFLGKEITHSSTNSIVASGLVIAPEGNCIFPLMTVAENLLLGAYHVKKVKTKYMKRALARFPILEERINQLAGTLSGGEQKMLDIARLLMSEPKLLVFDEPSLGLAPIIVDELFDIIVGLKREGYSILLSEQNARMALEASDRAYVLDTGKVILEGDSKKLESHPMVRHAYLGIVD